MMSGRTPGEIGIYGFRNRSDYSYGNLRTATSCDVRVTRIWDLLGESGRDSILLGVPGTYPAPPIRGWVVGDFLAPSTTSPNFTAPPDLCREIADVAGDYILDVVNFRADDKARIAQQLFDMTEQRFALARHLVTSRPWDLFAMVDMGPDRLHHAFWKYCDTTHPRYEPGPFVDLFRDYYIALDRHLAMLLEALGDDVTVLVVSDHGAKAMLGGFCINEWLADEGLLRFKLPIRYRTPIAEAPIDWRRTMAWGDGGYYGRIFLNVEGREPSGVVPARRCEEVLALIADKLEALCDHEGKPMGNRVLRPSDVYPDVVGIPPDLIVYFGDLQWRSVGTIGLGDGWYTFENDIGPDDANHAENGVALLSGPGIAAGRREDMSLLDIAPTAQAVLGLSTPHGQRGRVLT